MKQLIKDVLEDVADSQPNLHSEAARENIATAIMSSIKVKGTYTEYTDREIDEQKMKDSWVCSICGKSTFEVDYDYIGSGTNHLGCELKSQKEIDEYVEDIDEQAYAQGRGSSHREYPYNSFVRTKKEKRETNDRRKGDRREKNYSQKKHEDKVFPGVDAIQKQAYLEMTSDGLPEGGDAQAVLESHKLADEIVDNQDEKWIYESPDGGKTVFRRPFGDYDMKNKEEINWETKEPTGRKFTDYPFEDVQISGC